MAGGYAMGRGQGPAGYGMGPGTGNMAQRMPEGRWRPGMPGGPMGGSGTMGGPGVMSGSGTAMLDGIARLDLSDEQRATLNAIRADLNRRQQELMKRIAAAGDKLHKLYQEQMRARRTISDLNGHVMQANMDAANRAEELLTDEQRERLISAGSHVMTPQRLP